MGQILLIDNFDSFTYNLYQQVQKLYSGNVNVIRNNEIPINEIQKKYSAIIISPGPKQPKHAGISMKVIDRFATDIPILGICLGMQCINEVYGGITTNSNYPVHGKAKSIPNDGTGLFVGTPNNFQVARYHSLKIENISNELIINSKTNDGIVMSIMHKKLPVFGLQFHPESFMTEYGDCLIENFLDYVD